MLPAQRRDVMYHLFLDISPYPSYCPRIGMLRYHGCRHSGWIHARRLVRPCVMVTGFVTLYVMCMGLVFTGMHSGMGVRPWTRQGPTRLYMYYSSSAAVPLQRHGMRFIQGLCIYFAQCVGGMVQ